MAKKITKKLAKTTNARTGKNIKTITVKNAVGDPDTTAEILIQNKISYTPKVSVIIPVYNVEKYLRECIGSIIKQSLKEIEIICVDDGSTDKSLEILLEYAKNDKRITVIAQKNLHAGIARNAGISVARGEYLSFLDGDDFFDLNMLEEMYNTAKKDGSDTVICGNYIYNDTKKQVTNQTKIGQKFIDASPFSPNIFSDCLLTSCNPNPWTKMFSKALFDKNNLRYENFIRCNDITCICTAMIASQKISMIDKPFIYYRSIRENNATSKRANMIDCFLYAANKLEKNLEQLNLYKSFEQAFLSRIKSSFAWELSACTEEQKQNVKQMAKNILSDRLYNELYQPKVSVIIPCYNVELYLRECLDSVINQTCKEIEIICVNDGSKDGTLEILREYEKKDNRITVIDQKNQGLSCSRNNALGIATGEYILFLDSDDWLRNDSCDLLYNHAKKHNLDMVNFEGIKYYDDTGEYEEHNGLKTLYTPDEDTVFQKHNIESIVNQIPISACLLFYKHEFIKTNKLRFPEGLFFEDNLFVHTALNCVNRYGVKKQQLYYRRAHAAQATQNWDKLFSHYVEIVKLITDFYLEKSSFKQETKDKIINNFLVGAIYRWSTFTALLKQKYIPELYDTVTNISKHVNCPKYVTDFLQKNNPKDLYAQMLCDWYLRVKKENLNIENPQTYNEKLQWLKLYNSTPIKTLLADKHLVRDWVAKTIGKKYLVPIYGSFDSFDEIDFDKLPDKFVIKTNHGCGWNIIVTDKSKLDMAEAKSKMDRWMSDNYAYKWGTELHYRDIKPKIIIEKYIDPAESNHEIQIWCFSKQIKFVSVESIKDADTLVRGTFYPDEKPTEFAISPNHYKKMTSIPDKKAFHKALELAKKMLVDVPYVRIDFIEYNGSVLFRELTFTSGSGLSVIEPEKFNRVLGDWIQLPRLAYNIDTGEYYKLKKIKPQISKEKREIKPYLLFPYYILASMFMRLGRIPLLKAQKYSKVFLYSRSHRGKTDMLNQNFAKIMQSVASAKSELSNHIAQIKNQQNDLQKLINTVAENQKKIVDEKFASLSRQITDFTNASKSETNNLSQQILTLTDTTTNTLENMTSMISKIPHKIHNVSENIINLISEQKSATMVNSEKTNRNIAVLASETKSDFAKISKQLSEQTDLTELTKNIADTFAKISKQMSEQTDLLQKDSSELNKQNQSSFTELTKNIADTKENIVSALDTNKKDIINNNIEQNNVLYFNPTAIATLSELGMCDMTSAPNFEERFKKLMAGLPAESAETVVKIIRKLQQIKGAKSKLDIFTTTEQEQLRKLRDLSKEILKVSDNLYAYKNYMLPINHFEPSVFVYNHGISQLNSVDTFKDKDILDVGGFIGDSVLMLAPLTSGKVHSFEATTENYNHMLKTIELNGIKNAVPVHTAVGDKPGEIELRFNGSASTQNDIMVKNPKYVEKCPVITIDDYVREHNLNVGLIKVDIEGAEQSFLRGAYETIRTQKPTLLISIYHNVDDFLDIKPMIESWNLGYKFKIFKPTIGSIASETLLICEQ